MNNVNIIGRLTADPIIRSTQSGKMVANITLAVNRIKKDEADFINCIAWEKTAELIEKYCKKGSQLGVSGEIRTSTYEKDGQKHYKTDILITRLTFVSNSNNDNKKSQSGKETNDDVDDFPF